jgi:choline dehydrogenase-like flavoprotein
MTYVPVRSKESSSVVVVGCGAGGSVIAKELADAGLSVVVLEAGRRRNAEAEYRSDRREFPLNAADPFRSPDDEAYTAGPGGFHYHHVRGVGGTTLVSWGVSPRLHASDFKARSLDGVADDWPLTYEEIEPYYVKVEYELGMSGPVASEANPFDSPRSRPFPTPPHPMTKAGRLFSFGARRLGLHPYSPALAMPTVPWDGRRACIEAGTCMYGCRIEAKSSADVTYVRKAERTGRVEIRTECVVRAIELDTAGKARGVIYFDHNKIEHRAEARAVVLAANAIETPRLLLLSRSARYPDGLANSSGLVGKYLLDHLDAGILGRSEQPLEGWKGVPVSAMLQDFYETNPRNSFARGWLLEVSTGGSWPIALAKRIGGWGTAHKTAMKHRFGHEFSIFGQGEQLPDERNQVVLDPDVTDRFGLPVPKIFSQARGNDLPLLSTMSQSIRDLVAAMGVKEILSEWSHTPGASAHYMGTCRMGQDPQRSVVDRWGRAHDVPNMFIADASIFVTAGSAHPTLTLMALASRTADFMIEAFKRGDL